ncbi:MAG: DUF2188 domain-containing protein [Nocardioidaceae bacterium]
MPRTLEELEKAATDAETWLESLDPAATPAEDPTDLRRIGLALRHLADDQREVDEAVAAARENGRSWGEIGLVLGISRQAARERYGQPAAREQSPRSAMMLSTAPLAGGRRKGNVMAEKKNVHTVPTNDGWANRREGGKSASSTHDTKAEAQAAGRAAAKKDGVEHLIHKKDGTIGDRNSYGADPHPPKG